MHGRFGALGPHGWETILTPCEIEEHHYKNVREIAEYDYQYTSEIAERYYKDNTVKDPSKATMTGKRGLIQVSTMMDGRAKAKMTIAMINPGKASMVALWTTFRFGLCGIHGVCYSTTLPTSL